MWQWITGPLIGGIIGYITNDVAVRMMFRPHTEKYILGRKVPFTPGLIPKERPRLASAIRDVLDKDLLSPEVLKSALLSDAVLAQIDAAAAGAIGQVLAEERTPRVLAQTLVGKESFDTFEARARRAASIFLMEKILQSGIEQTVAEIAVNEARTRVSNSTAGVAKLFWDDRRSHSMEESLSRMIREMLATHAPALIDETIENTLHDGLDTPVNVLARQHADKLDGLRAFLVEQYQNLVRVGLDSALRVLDLGAVVEDKLNALDMAELEALIMRVMRKELRAIVWLGALLGAVMGTLNAAVLMFL